jgi:hypothetical protein
VPGPLTFIVLQPTEDSHYQESHPSPKPMQEIPSPMSNSVVMKNPSRQIRRAALCALSLALALPTLAAPKPDPRVVGHWRGVVPGAGKDPATMDLTFKSDATEAFTIHAPKEVFSVKATYTAASGVMVMTMLSATDNGKTISKKHPEHIKYTVTPTTLTLDDGTPDGKVTLHRISR